MRQARFIFYLIILLFALVVQIFVAPFLYSYALLIFLWSEWETEEVYFWLISAFVLDLISSLPFGVYFCLSAFTLWLTRQLLRRYLRAFSPLSLALWSLGWEGVFLGVLALLGIRGGVEFYLFHLLGMFALGLVVGLAKEKLRLLLVHWGLIQEPARIKLE